jgi:hypothetical protein
MDSLKKTMIGMPQVRPFASETAVLAQVVMRQSTPTSRTMALRGLAVGTLLVCGFAAALCGIARAGTMPSATESTQTAR